MSKPVDTIDEQQWYEAEMFSSLRKILADVRQRKESGTYGVQFNAVSGSVTLTEDVIRRTKKPPR